MSDPLVAVAWAQAAYFGVTGVWPLVSIRTFMAVTGPKRDVWLVKTVGVIVAAIAVSIGVAAARHEFTAATFVLAVGAAAALGAVDVWYAGRGVISKIYLADAVVEVGLIVGWVLLWRP